jgi:hypothetical protein
MPARLEAAEQETPTVAPAVVTGFQTRLSPSEVPDLGEDDAQAGGAAEPHEPPAMQL